MTWTDLWLRHVASTKRPILIGPWRSELGFECTYWLPWLLQWRLRYKIDKSRLFVISRGGAGHWYDAAHSVELYDYATVERLRKALLEDAALYQSVKQHRVTAWERHLLPLIAKDLGLRRYHLLHPSLMYNALKPWWDGDVGQKAALQQLAFGDFPTPQPPLSLPLPEKFVAMRFYARPTWHLTDDNKALMENLITYLTKHIPVVVLNTGLPTDDHLEFPVPDLPNVINLAPHVTLQNNLAIQSAVIARSVGFVGTYGGTMQLAARLRKPSIGFFDKFQNTIYAHKSLIEWLCVQQHTPCFIGRPEDARWVREVMGV